MSKRAQLPDGTILEFPDETPDDVMDKAVRSHIAEGANKPFVNSVGRIPKPNPNAPGANPTEGQSFGTNFWAGAGKSLVDTGQGLKQIGASVADFVSPRPQTMSGLITGQDNSRSAEMARSVDERRRTDAPLMNTVGGFAGNVAGQTAQIAAPVGGGLKGLSMLGKAAPYAEAAIRGAAFSGSQGVGQGESRAMNTATGAGLGVLGQGIATGVGKLATAAKARLQPEVQKSIELARKAGIPLHVSQVTNSRFAKTVGSVLNQLPFTGAGKAAQAQQEAFNKAVARSFGSDATTLSDDAMKAAGDKLGQQYENIFAGKTVGLDRQAVADLFKLHKEVGNNLEASQAAVVRKQIERILDEGGQLGTMPGKVYQSLRSELRKNFGKEDAMGRQVMEARRALDDAAKRTLGPDAAKALDKVNGQYANFQTAKAALKQVGGGVNVGGGAAGNIRPAALYPLIRNGSTEPMRELAKIGQNVLKDPIPDSATSTRELVLKGLGAGGGATMAGLALPAVAKIGALGAGLGRLMNSNTASKMLGQGRPTEGLARLMKPAPQVLPGIGNATGMFRSDAILEAAMGAPHVGPEIIANLSPEEQQAAIMQFAQANGMDPQEVAQRVQIESERLAAQRR